MTHTKLSAAMLAVALLGACNKEASAPPMAGGQAVDGTLKVIDLNQGWSHADQDGASFASFGSRLLPKDWLQHLERAGNTDRFVSNANMEAFGFLARNLIEYLKSL